MTDLITETKATSSNMELWNNVCKTNPEHTKPAKIGGMNITAIAPMYQIQQATEQFGPYGSSWGLKNIERDFQLIDKLNLVIFSGVFYFPGGEFEISTSHSIFMDKAGTMVDKDFCKKMETDLLTKALSKVGFNADVFMGRFDDVRYVSEMREEFKEKPVLVNNDQLSVLFRALDAVKMKHIDFCTPWNIKDLTELHADNLQNALNWIKASQPQADAAGDAPEQAERQAVEAHEETVEEAMEEFQARKSAYLRANRESTRKIALSPDQINRRESMPAKQPTSRQERQQTAVNNAVRAIQPAAKVITPHQIQTLRNTFNFAGITEQRFLRACKIDHLGQLEESRFSGAMDWLFTQAPENADPRPSNNTANIEQQTIDNARRQEQSLAGRRSRQRDRDAEMGAYYADQYQNQHHAA